MSDLNDDGVVDYQDLEDFSTKYLLQDWDTVNWCNFYHAATKNERFFRRHTASRSERFTRLLKFIADTYGCPRTSRAVDKSDLNADGVVDLADLGVFSTNYLEKNVDTVDWCLFHESTLAGTNFKSKKGAKSKKSGKSKKDKKEKSGKSKKDKKEKSGKGKKSEKKGRPTKYFLKHFQNMLTFMNDQFACGGSEPPPTDTLLENEPINLARIAGATAYTDDYYITDPRVGSVFIYDADLVLKAEIKGLSKPLGVAIDLQGNILVGNDGRDNIEVYDPANGSLLAVFGEGELHMPAAITVDGLGNIYVTDSQAHNIKVFDSDYNLIRLIGSYGTGTFELDFPIDTVVVDATGELLVADQGNSRIQIYDLEGNWLRVIEPRCGWWRCYTPAFDRAQALALDPLGRLHILDNFSATVIVHDPADGAYVGTYGQYGQGAGFLTMPMDLVIPNADTSIVTPGAARVETLAIPW
jgi:DNA-binding beta-propeller fold protein YncE